VGELQQFLVESKEKSLNADHFLPLVQKYTNIRKFVERINVFQTEKVDGHRQQRF
jgi:hypothetical protein